MTSEASETKNGYRPHCYVCGKTVEPGEDEYDPVPFRKRYGTRYGVKRQLRHKDCKKLEYLK